MSRRTGFAPVVSVAIVAATGLLLCASHFVSARNLRLSGQDQAEYLQARAMAQAGLAKALVVLKREHQAGCYAWSYPDQSKGRWVPGEEFAGELDGGRFAVASVAPLTLDDGEEWIGPFVDRPYVTRRKARGRYDVYRVEATGTAPGGRRTVRVVALAKMVRLYQSAGARD